MFKTFEEDEEIEKESKVKIMYRPIPPNCFVGEKRALAQAR